MSLDFYLEADEPVSLPERSGILIRRNGRSIEISRDEWDLMCPGTEPVVFHRENPTRTVFNANITHNLRPMAIAAGLGILWEDPDVTAEEILPILKAGYAKLLNDHDEFRKYDCSWGNYDSMMEFLMECIGYCQKYPEAKVRTSR